MEVGTAVDDDDDDDLSGRREGINERAPELLLVFGILLSFKVGGPDAPIYACFQQRMKGRIMRG